MSDPIDRPVPIPADDAPTTEHALAFWEIMRNALAALTVAADETAAKNFVSITLTGMRAPFERAEIHLVRPGGSTPSEMVVALKQDNERLAAEVQRRGTVIDSLEQC